MTRMARNATLATLILLAVARPSPVRSSSYEAVFGYHNYPEELAAATATLRGANPVTDADAAVLHGNATLIEACGLGCFVPGIGFPPMGHSARVVPGYSGCIVNGAEHVEYREAVEVYAEAFNTRVIALTEGGPHEPNGRAEK